MSNMASFVRDVSKVSLLLKIFYYFCVMQSSYGHRLCGHVNHNKSTGELVPFNEEILAGHECVWHIYPDKHEMKGVLLVFETFDLESNDECLINEHEGPKLFGPLSGRKDAFSILVNSLKLDVIVKAETNSTSPRKFKLSYSTIECLFMIRDHMDSGHMASPFYNVTEENITCTWEIKKLKDSKIPRVITFEEFNLSNSTLVVKRSQDKNPIILSGTDAPHPIVVQDSAILELRLNRKVPDQIFSFNYSIEGTDPGEVTEKPIPVTDSGILPPCGRSYYEDLEGMISLNDESMSDDFSCSWVIDCENNTNAKEIHISFEQFVLAGHDTLILKDQEGQDLFGPYEGKKNPFAVLTGVVNLNIQLQVKRSNQRLNRKLEITYNAKDCITELKNEIGIAKLPIYNSARKNKNVTCSWISSEKDTVKKASFLHHKFNGQLLFGRNVNPKKFYSENDYIPDALIQENGLIELNFETNKETEFSFVYRKVSSDCSLFIQLTDKNSTFLLTSNIHKSNTYWANCFWIIESQKNTVINVEIQKLNLTDVEDFMIINDGGSRKAPILSQFTYENQKHEDKNVISRNNSILVYFNTQFVEDSKFEAKLSVTTCSSFCDNGRCKLSNWNCNGHNDCGDNSDEENCEAAQSTLKPSEQSNTKKENTGVSKLAIGLSIPAAFVFGICCTVAIAAAYQMYVNRRQNDYGSFPIYDS